MTVFWPRWSVALAVIGICASSASFALAQAPATKPASSEAEKALDQVAGAFAQAYNAGKAKDVAELYAKDAELIDENGDRVVGRPAIEEVYALLFRDQPGSKISIAKESVRFLTPDVATEEGLTSLKVGGKAEVEEIRRYRLIYVKQAGKWLYSSVREEHEPFLPPHERLKSLAWLVGDWIDESSDSTVYVSCHWSDDKNFLLRDFVIHVQGKPVMKVQERIGWDPLTRQFKGWVFDSEGGHSENHWSRQGDAWTIKSNGVLPDGRVVSATHVLSRRGSQTIHWTSVERTVGGHTAADVDDFVMVRHPPKPASSPAK